MVVSAYYWRMEKLTMDASRLEGLWSENRTSSKFSVARNLLDGELLLLFVLLLMA